MAAATLPSLSTPPAATVTGPTSPLPLKTRAGRPASGPDTAENLPIPDDAAPDSAAPRFPRALKDRAFDLYAHGFRSPAIASQLGVSERTVRHWLQTTIQQLTEDDVTANPEIARQQRALAIESQRAVAATAWTAYQQLSDAYTHLLSRALAPTNSQPERLLAGINRLASNAARHLSVVIGANREIARLQGQAVTQASREQHAASRQAEADAADLLRILTMPIPTPSARPSTLDALPPTQSVTTQTAVPSTATLSSNRNITETVTPYTGDLPAPDFPPLPDHIIAAVMNRYREMEAAGVFDSEDADDPIAAPQTKIPAKMATPTTPTTRHLACPTLPSPAHGGGAGERAHHRQGAEQQQSAARGQGERSATPSKTKIAAKTATPTAPTTATPAIYPLPGTVQAQVEKPGMPSKSKIAAKTATPPHHKNKPNRQPTIAIPSRTARKLKNPRTA